MNKWVDKIIKLFVKGGAGRVVLKDLFVVILIGGLLFGISGVWPPLVAIESGSMEPNLQEGDLVFLMAVQVGEGKIEDVKTRREGENYYKFGERGDVIVFNAEGSADLPVILRVEFWVDEGEDWYDRGNPKWVVGKNCDMMPNCPSPHAGYITKGDNNGNYAQADGISGPVRPSWVKGTAEIRIPWMGYIKLIVNEVINLIILFVRLLWKIIEVSSNPPNKCWFDNNSFSILI